MLPYTRVPRFNDPLDFICSLQSGHLAPANTEVEHSLLSANYGELADARIAQASQVADVD